MYLPIEFEDLFLGFRLLCRSVFIKCSPEKLLSMGSKNERQLLRNVVLLSLDNANDGGESLHVKCNIIETTSQGFASHHIRWVTCTYSKSCITWQECNFSDNLFYFLVTSFLSTKTFWNVVRPCMVKEKPNNFPLWIVLPERFRILLLPQSLPLTIWFKKN